MRARTLITGGAGFIGSHLARHCIERGDEVHIVVRSETSLDRIADLADDIIVHALNMADEQAVTRCFAEARPDRVFHLAIETRRRALPNVADTLDAARIDVWNLLILMKAMAETQSGPRVLIRTGSIAEYGPLPTPFREGQREAPSTAYSAALVAGTHYMGMLRSKLPFAAVTARLALVYGPGQSQNFLIPALIRSCLDRAPFRVERPRDRRDLLHVDDAVDALWRLAVAPPRDCNVVNIATGIAPTMREAATYVIEATGAPPALVEFAESRTEDSSLELRAATELAREVMGWSATTPLEEGITRTVERMRESRRMPA